MPKIKYKILLYAILFLSYSCNNDLEKKVNISDISTGQQFLRFEKDLFANGDSLTINQVTKLHNRYGMFFELFCSRVIRIPANNDSTARLYLAGFASDPDVKEIYRLADSVFADTKDIKTNLETAFRYYKHYFPSKAVPTIVTYISAFNYQVITADSILGIGLDMYLGENRQGMYSSVGFPQYMFRRFNRPYIAVDAMKGWFQSEYEIDSVKNELLSQMLYYGKLLYFLDYMLPELNDTLKTGFTGEQLTWCQKNEVNIWAHLIEQNLLYSSVQQEYFKFIQDGPTTNGLPKESPARLGWFIGHNIIKSFMKENKVSLEELLRENDAQKILNASKYKPSK